MTRGRKGEATYTGYNGAREASLRAMDKLAKTPAGEFGRVTNPESVEAIRRSLEAFICPWCGEGPYKLLASHTNRAHGVDRKELRELAGLLKNSSITPDDVRERRRQLGRERGMPTAAREAHRKRREYSAAGLAAQRAKLQLAWAATADSPAQAAAAATRASVEATRARTADQHRQAAAMWVAGRGMCEIARVVGLSEAAVRRGLRRAGIYEDGRARVAAKPSTELWTEMAKRAREGTVRKARERRVERLARFHELGACWAAVSTLESEWGVSRKHVVQMLRSMGASLPDGRIANPRRGPRPDLKGRPLKALR